MLRYAPGGLAWVPSSQSFQLQASRKERVLFFCARIFVEMKEICALGARMSAADSIPITSSASRLCLRAVEVSMANEGLSIRCICFLYCHSISAAMEVMQEDVYEVKSVGGS